jgi:hypothetical protein
MLVLKISSVRFNREIKLWFPEMIGTKEVMRIENERRNVKLDGYYLEDINETRYNVMSCDMTTI